MSRSSRRRTPPLIAALLLVGVAGCSNSPVAPKATPGVPGLSCPAPITIAGVKTPTQVVVYPKPILTGGAAPIQSSCMPSQGSAFPLGTTIVQCTTTDSLNRLASCSFPISLTRSVLGAQRFLAFGDSITRGEDGLAAGFSFSIVNPATAYPTVLSSLLNAEFPGQGIAVTNSGKSGEVVSCSPPPADATCGVDRLASELLVLRPPQVLLLLHGYNDLNNPANVGKVVTALRDSVRIARAARVQYILVSTITPGRKATGPFDRQRDAQTILNVNAGIRSMAQAEGAHLVDSFAAFLGRELELVNVDGLHLTSAGFAVLAETFYARIRQVVPATEQSAGSR